MSDLDRLLTGIVNRDPAVLAEIASGEAAMRADRALRASEETDRKRRISALARTASVRRFRAANRSLNRNEAPLELLYAVDEAARAIDCGVLPNNVESLTMRMGVHKF